VEQLFASLGAELERTMSAGLVIEVRAVEEETAAVPVLAEGDLQSRYDCLLARVMRMGDWLLSPHARLLPAEQWDEQFARYQEELERLRVLGDELRPVSLRDRHEPLAGDALTGEILELFAA
jgi:hypothetical protein